MLLLYSAAPSSASYRVRIALELKGLDYEILPLDLNSGQHLSDEYRARNPESRVPLLVDGHFSLGQSMAIFDYLEARAPNPPLFPESMRLRARVLAFCQLIASDVQPLQTVGTLRMLAELGLPPEGIDRWKAHWIHRGLSLAEQAVVAHGDHGYCFDEVPTAADCLLVPQMHTAVRLGLTVDAYPRLRRITERCLAHPAFAAAHPDRHPAIKAG